MKKALHLFLIMFKIGLFTFGGGYAMIPLLENEFVSKKQWLEHDEFTDMLVIAESTPGPIAINSATYIGYKRAGVLGSIFATFGVVLPSFLIIFCLSLFLNEFLEIELVAAAFKGIQVCVVFLIMSAGIKLFKKMKKSIINYFVLVATFICVVLFSLFAVNFSSILYILIAAVIGLVSYLVIKFKTKNVEDKK